MALYKALRIGAVLWAWGCWAWVTFSHQWLWLILSLIPYLLLNKVDVQLEKHDE